MSYMKRETGDDRGMEPRFICVKPSFGAWLWRAFKRWMGWERRREASLALETPGGTLAMDSIPAACGKDELCEAKRKEEPEMNERRSTMDMVCEALDARGHGYDVRADSSVIRTGFQGRNSRFNVLITAQGEDTRLAVLVHMAPIVPEDRRREMAELVVRANDGLAMGRFDLDMSDGTMAYYASMPVVDGTVTAGQFDDLMYCALTTADCYVLAINRLLYGDDLSPAEVVAEVEMAR
jgi:hypothetical protein